MYDMQMLVDDLSKNHIPFVRDDLKEDDKTTITYEVPGFGKSGTVWVVNRNGLVECIALHGETTVITCFDDLLEVAWDWYKRDVITLGQYSAYPSTIWVDLFVARDWLSPVTRYEITRA